MKKEDLDAKTEEIIKGLGLEGAKMSIPWIYDAMSAYDVTPGQSLVADFYANVPPPLKLFNWISWQRCYERDNRDKIDSVGRDVKVTGWFFKTIVIQK